MAIGIPVIASNFPLYRAIIENNSCGLCVDPLDPNGIADAIQWIFSNPEEGSAMGLRGQKAICKRYTWESQAGKLLKFYNEILNSDK